MRIKLLKSFNINDKIKKKKFLSLYRIIVDIKKMSLLKFYIKKFVNKAKLEKRFSKIIK